MNIPSDQDNTYKFELIAEKVRENIEDVLESLEIYDYENYQDKIVMACPIHGGDNKDACNIFIGEKAYVVNWKCFTHHCQTNTNPGIFGFIQARLSIIQNKKLKIGNAIAWCEKLFSKTNFVSKRRFNANDWTQFCESDVSKVNKIEIKKEHVVSRLMRPVHFYISKGIKNEVLNKYDVGICINPKKPFYNRIVIPIFDKRAEFVIGCVGRSLNKKCDKCKYYHDGNNRCPETKLERYIGAKWINSPGFRAENYFFNYWFAEEEMLKTQTVILVEGQGDVWRIVQSGFNNVLGCFGSKIKVNQKNTLINSGIMNIIIFADPDKAGQEFADSVKEELGRYFNIFSISNDKDPQDTKEEKIQELVNSIYKKIGL